MSWWNSNFSNLASSALKSAQKQIDKVLEIQEEGDDETNASAGQKAKKAASTNVASTWSGDDFWGAWLDKPAEDSSNIEDDAKLSSNKSLQKQKIAVPGKNSSSTLGVGKSFAAKSSVEAHVKSEEIGNIEVASRDVSVDDLHDDNDLVLAGGSGSVWGSFGLWGSESVSENEKPLPKKNNLNTEPAELQPGVKKIQLNRCDEEKNSSICNVSEITSTASLTKPENSSLTESWGEFARLLDVSTSTIAKLSAKGESNTDKHQNKDTKSDGHAAVLPSNVLSSECSGSQPDHIKRSDSVIMLESTDNLDFDPAAESFPYSTAQLPSNVLDTCTFHSSHEMAGRMEHFGSETFDTNVSVEIAKDDIDSLFAAVTFDSIDESETNIISEKDETISTDSEFQCVESDPICRSENVIDENDLQSEALKVLQCVESVKPLIKPLIRANEGNACSDEVVVEKKISEVPDYLYYEDHFVGSSTDPLDGWEQNVSDVVIVESDTGHSNSAFTDQNSCKNDKSVLTGTCLTEKTKTNEVSVVCDDSDGDDCPPDTMQVSKCQFNEGELVEADECNSIANVDQDQQIDDDEGRHDNSREICVQVQSKDSPTNPTIPVLNTQSPSVSELQAQSVSSSLDNQSMNMSGSTLSGSDSESSQLEKTFTQEEFSLGRYNNDTIDKGALDIRDTKSATIDVRTASVPDLACREANESLSDSQTVTKVSSEEASAFLSVGDIKSEREQLLSESSSDVTLVGDAGQMSELHSSSTDQSMNSSSSGGNNVEPVTDNSKIVINLNTSSSDLQKDAAVNNPDAIQQLEIDIGDGLGVCLEESTTSLGSTGSYVKCMLEDAINDYQDLDARSSGSDKSSDLVKVESDQNSGQTSGDEIDTTTSSDIEIISTPTPNGENRDRPFDLSPLRHTLSNTLRRVSPPSHKRTDSNSSSSGHSFDQLSPGRDAHMTSDPMKQTLRVSLDRGRTSKSSKVSPSKPSNTESDGSPSNPLHAERLLKNNTLIEDEVHEKLAEAAEVIEAREKKLLEISKENMDLHEANSILRNQLQQSEDTRATEMTDLEELTQEFTTRMSESEKILHQIARDRDNLKKQLKSTQDELAKKVEDRKSKMLLEEKDQQIEELLTEGEKLSKQQLQNSTIIKKLRSKEKETEQVTKSLKQKVDRLESENVDLRNVLDSRDEMEKRQNEVINQLNDAVLKQDNEIKHLQSELEDSQEKARGLKSTLDSSYKELADLHKELASKDSKAQEIALSAEVTAKEELRFTLEREKQQTKWNHENLQLQVTDLQMDLSRAEKEHVRRENVLRQEISDLQMRLQEAEARNQDLSQSVTLATRPLLRQIENLQSTYAGHSESWEKVEKSLTDRLYDAQGQMAEATQKERNASERLIDLNSRLSSFTSQNALLREEKTRISATLEMKTAKMEVLEEAKNKESVNMDLVKQSLQEEISKYKREKLFLENQLEMEKMKVETERKKVSIAYEQMREKSVESNRPLSRLSSSPQPSRTRSSSQSSDVLPPLTQDEVMEHTMMLSTNSLSKLNLYESMRQNGAANLLENLQSQLKQRDGEISQLQGEITALEKTRESLATELVDITNKNISLEETATEFELLSGKYKDLDQRYNAILTMYGEKVEQTEELRLDLQDMKDLYKSQIEELLNKSS